MRKIKIIFLTVAFITALINVSMIIEKSFNCALAQNANLKPFTIEQVKELIEQNVKQDEIGRQVERYKVDFKLTRENTTLLVRAGISDELIEKIENNYMVRDLMITSPRNNEECGKVVMVEGQSEIYPEKHLWVFAHRADLTNKWWPQTGAVKVNSDGSWFVGANLGREEDIGFPFEIVAIWIDENSNMQMENYLRTSERNDSYPSIQLPGGDPYAMVTVTKASH